MLSITQGEPIAVILPGCQLIGLDPDRTGPRGRGRSIALTSEYCAFPLPNTESREVVYIAGPSGAGKSSWAADYATLYHKIFPDLPIYLISRLTNDPVLDKVPGLVRVPLDDLDKIDISQLEGGLLIFDDTETIQDPARHQVVSSLKADVLETGRHQNLYVIITSHLINSTSPKDTRIIMNELHKLVIFPKSGNAHAMSYALKEYIGLSNDQVQHILQDIPSRWVCISRTYPLHLIYDGGAEIL